MGDDDPIQKKKNTKTREDLTVEFGSQPQKVRHKKLKLSRQTATFIIYWKAKEYDYNLAVEKHE